jgi:hypothetical protein
MVVELLNKKINVYVTCGSMPCLSIFKRWTFGTKPIYPILDNSNNEKYYYQMEKVKRKLMYYDIPKNFYKKRDVLEQLIIKNEISFKRSLIEEARLYKKILSDNKNIDIKYSRYWKKKNKRFEGETK